MDDRIIERFSESLAEARAKGPEELAALALISPAVHFACFVTIRNKDNQVITPVPNILQLRMSEAYETLRALGIKVRIICVKPRQVGCSSFAGHIGYHHGQRYSIEGITISDVDEHSEELLGKLKDYAKVDTFPWGNSVVKDPAQSISWSNGTKWAMDTAQNPNAGVGGTRQFGHFSEVSKWPQTKTRNDRKTMSAVLPSLSGQDSVAIAESTPEGAFGWQYGTWQEAWWLEDFLKAYEGGYRPDEVWIKVFAGWWEFPEHARKEMVSDGEVAQIRNSLTDHEKKEIELYDLSWEQLAWRRDTIKGVCGGDEKVFAYYYPSDDVSCWLASGLPRFDMQILTQMERRAKGVSPETGELVIQHDDSVAFIRSRDGSGDILVWEPPKPNLRYLVTIDPAGDISQSTGADPDRHSVSVWRQGYQDTLLNRWRPAMKVARVRPPLYSDGDVVAEFGVKLSRYYGRCIVVLETNYGTDILRLLKISGLPLYKRTKLSNKTKETIEQYGFKMDDREERNAIIEGFAAAIRTEEIEVLCVHSIGEYKTFISRTDKGRAEAAGGCHDDDVLADAIAWEAMTNATEYRQHVARHQDPPDRDSWRRVTRGW